MMELHEGQGMEIYWRDIDLKNPPNEDQYERIVVKSKYIRVILKLLNRYYIK